MAHHVFISYSMRDKAIAAASQPHRLGAPAPPPVTPHLERRAQAARRGSDAVEHVGLATATERGPEEPGKAERRGRPGPEPTTRFLRGRRWLPLAGLLGLTLAVLIGAGVWAWIGRPGTRDGAPAPGTVLIEDDFVDIVTGVLYESAEPPIRRGYLGGEYFIHKVDPKLQGVAVARLPGVFTDASLAVDARLLGDARDRSVNVTCRGTGDASGYRLIVVPFDGVFLLDRWDKGEPAGLGVERPSPAIRRGGAPNRIELSCAGGTIVATVNGTRVASLTDSRYREGTMDIGVSSSLGRELAVEGRFDNLKVTAR